MKTVKRTLGFFLALSMLWSVSALAAESIDADYSAAILSAMSEGQTPMEQEVAVETEGQSVLETAVEKEAYTTEVLTVRELPGTQYTEIGKLAKYAKVPVVGVCDNGWSKVQMENGTVGYASGEYLSDTIPEGAQNIGESLGMFTVTYYCSCEICCGWWSGGPTASGAYPVADWTVAADPDVLPLGTRIYINGHEYCVEDTGSGVDGAHIDIYVDDHQLAVNNGIGSVEIFASKS